MSAIEMMDPKMDAGMMCNQTKRKVLNLQQSIEVRHYHSPVLCVLILSDKCYMLHHNLSLLQLPNITH